MDASCNVWLQAVLHGCKLSIKQQLLVQTCAQNQHLTCFALTLSAPDVITDMASSLCHAAAGAVIIDTQGTEDPDQRIYR